MYKRQGHTLPLVWSGDSREESRNKNVRATRNGVAVTMMVQTFNYTNPRSPIKMRDEFTKVTQQETQNLTEVGTGSVEKQLRRFKGRRNIKV